MDALKAKSNSLGKQSDYSSSARLQNCFTRIHLLTLRVSRKLWIEYETVSCLKQLCEQLEHLLSVVCTEEILSYSPIAFDERVPFWLQRVRSLPCACVYVVLFTLEARVEPLRNRTRTYYSKHTCTRQ